MNTNELDAAYIGGSPVTKLYNGSVLVWESGAPVGRTFNVGSGSGELVIDGEDGPWGTLLPYDRIIIAAGSYTSITWNNLSVDTGYVQVEAAGALTCTDYLNLAEFGNTKNLILDFKKGFGSGVYGLTVNSSSTSPKFYWDYENVGGLENITIRGIDSRNMQNQGWDLSSNLAYNNGAGTVSKKNIVIEDCRFITTNSTDCEFAIQTGNLYTWSDTNFIDRITMRRCVLQGGRNNISIHNAMNILIQDCEIIGSNAGKSAHERIFNLGGHGLVERVIAKQHYGNIVRFIPYNRGSAMKTIVRNIIGFEAEKYSCLEFNYPELENIIRTGIVVSDVNVQGITAVDMSGNNPSDASTCCMVYAAGAISSTVTAKNCLAVNPYSTTSAVAGPYVAESNNQYYANKTAAGLTDTVTFRPSSGSGAKGAGVLDADLTEDFYEASRLNPPTVGAVEAS